MAGSGSRGADIDWSSVPYTPAGGLLPTSPGAPSPVPLFGPGAGAAPPSFDPFAGVPTFGGLNPFGDQTYGPTPGNPQPAYNPPDLQPPGVDLGQPPAGGGNVPSWESVRSNWTGPGGSNVSLFPTTWSYQNTPNGPQWVPRAVAASPTDIQIAQATNNAAPTGNDWWNSAPTGSVGPVGTPSDSNVPGSQYWAGLLGHVTI